MRVNSVKIIPHPSIEMVIKSDVRNKVVADREIGKPIKEIMTEHSISKASVHKILNERTKSLNIGGALQSDNPVAPADPAALEAVIENLDINELVNTDGPKPKPTKAGPKLPKAPKAPKAVAVPAVPEPTWSNMLATVPTSEEDKAQLIQKITLNVNYYGDTVLKDLISNVEQFKSSLIKKSSSELKNLLALFESTRNIESTSMYIRNTYFIGTKLLENTGGLVKMRLGGLTERLRAEQDLEMLFKEIAITHASKFSKATSPEMRLLMITLSSIVQVDMMNRVMNGVPQQSRPKPVEVKQVAKEEQKVEANSAQQDAEELLKKFSDL